MTIGDVDDSLRRLQALIPSSWFRDSNTDESALLTGAAATDAFIYALVAYAKDQTRLQSTTDGFADMAAWDYFGSRIKRRAGESDANFMLRVIKEILRERVTRRGIIQAVVDLTGVQPIFVEPPNPADTFAWDVSYWDAMLYGSTQLRNQVFITAFRPEGGGIANWPGWDNAFWDANMFWIDQSMVTAPVSDAEIYSTIAACVAAGVTAWVMIENTPVAQSHPIIQQIQADLAAGGAIRNLGRIIDPVTVTDSLGTLDSTDYIIDIVKLGTVP